MPILTAKIPKYRRHKATGQAVVTVLGKDHYLGPYGTKASRLEYDRLIGEWLAAGRPSAITAPQNEITVMEVAAAFLKHAKLQYRKHGRSTGTAENFRPVLALLRTRYGHTRAADFGPLALKALQAAMLQEGSSRRYINDNTHRIRQVIRWAASEQLVSPLVHQGLLTVATLRKGQSVARENDPVLPVDDAIVEATLPCLSAVVADMVRLQRLTGARPGEIIGIRPSAVKRDREVWEYIPDEHKTEHHGHGRTIFLGPKAQEILRPYLLRDEEDFCFRPCDSERKRRQARHASRTTPQSCGNRPGTNRKRKPARCPGNRYTNDSYRRAIARGCELAFNMPLDLRKIPRTMPEPERVKRQEAAAQWRAKHVWTPNRLRHTAATNIRQRYGLEAAQVTLGHSRMNVTEIYAEKNYELASRVAREVG